MASGLRPVGSRRSAVGGRKSGHPPRIVACLLLGLSLLAASELQTVRFGPLRLSIPAAWQPLSSATADEARYGPAGADPSEATPEQLATALNQPLLGLSLRPAQAATPAQELALCQARLLQVQAAARIELLPPRRIGDQDWQGLRGHLSFLGHQIPVHLLLTHMPDGRCAAISLRLPAERDPAWLQDFFESLRVERTTQD